MKNLQQHLSTSAYANVQKWLNEPKFAEFKPEIEALIAAENWQALEDAFFMDIEFGTAGMRGIVGVGPNRINNLTVGAAAQGLAQLLLNKSADSAQQGVVIAYDTRNSSRQLAELTACVIIGNGLKAYLFDSFGPTPKLSFAVRHLKAAAGVMITASHNPPEYNGFKVYADYGGQLVAPDDKGVMEQVHAVTDIKMGDLSQVQMLGQEVDEAYFKAVIADQTVDNPQLSVVYSPLHGAGQKDFVDALSRAGFKISPVEAQMVADGNFPNVAGHKPNPEEPGANTLATEQMLAENADLAFTTDPDVDRLGVVVNHKGMPVALNGNESAALIMNYVMRKCVDPANAYVCKTIVTTNLITAISEKYQIKIFSELPVGFKYFGQLMESTSGTCLAGAEESYGMLVGTHARDKDAISGALALAKYALECKRQGKTLYDELLALYQEFGIYRELVVNVEFKGAAGFHKMQEVMEELSNNPPATIGGLGVDAVYDYSTHKKTLRNGEVYNFEYIVKTGMISFEVNGGQIVIRPSGTEPKLKIYLMLRFEHQADQAIEAESKEAQTIAAKILEAIKQQLLG